MKISIVVNNYNYERFIAKAIDSALAQEHDDVEVIVADDGSTDNSRALIARYGSRIKRIDQPNGGQRAAYNAGYGLVTGQIVIFLDADDWLYPDVCTAVAQAWRAGVSKIQFYLDLVDIDGAPMGRRVPRMLHSQRAMHALANFGAYASAAGSGNAYPIDYLRHLMPLDTTPRHLPADSEPILYAPAYGTIVSIERSLGAYRIHKTVGSEPLLLNNMPTSLWSEFARMQHDKGLAARQLDRMNLPRRSPMFFAPWEARLLMLCLRFGGPRPPALLDDIPHPTWFAFRSLWTWTVLSPADRLLISGWMCAVRLLPRRLAARLANMHRQLAGSAAPAPASAAARH